MKIQYSPLNNEMIGLGLFCLMLMYLNTEMKFPCHGDGLFRLILYIQTERYLFELLTFFSIYLSFLPCSIYCPMSNLPDLVRNTTNFSPMNEGHAQARLLLTW